MRAYKSLALGAGIAAFVPLWTILSSRAEAQALTAICGVSPLQVEQVPTGLGLFAAGYTSARDLFNRLNVCVSKTSETVEKHDESISGLKDDVRFLKEDLHTERDLRGALDERVAALERGSDGKNTSPDTIVSALERRVAALERDIAALRSRPPNRVTAPFQVVDSAGRNLLDVRTGTKSPATQGVAILVGAESTDLALLANGEPLTVVGPGYLAAYRSGEKSPRVAMSARRAQVLVADGEGNVRATMLAEDVGGPKVAVLASDGNTLSGVGVNEAGGNVFANGANGAMAFKAGALDGGDADACVSTAKRGMVCLKGILPLR